MAGTQLVMRCAAHLFGGWRLRSEAAVWNGNLDSDTHTPANTSLVKALFEAEADRCRVN